MPSPNEILAELKKLKHPGFTRDIVSFGIIKDIEVTHRGVTVTLNAPTANPEVVAQIVGEVKRAVAAMAGAPAVEVAVAQPAPAARTAATMHRRPVPGVGRVIAVASGKGG